MLIPRSNRVCENETNYFNALKHRQRIVHSLTEEREIERWRARREPTPPPPPYRLCGVISAPRTYYPEKSHQRVITTKTVLSQSRNLFLPNSKIMIPVQTWRSIHSSSAVTASSSSSLPSLLWEPNLDGRLSKFHTYPATALNPTRTTVPVSRTLDQHLKVNSESRSRHYNNKIIFSTSGRHPAQHYGHH